VPGDVLTRDGEAQIGHAPEQGGKRNVPFQAGQRRPQTGVDAMPKGEMAADRARKIQLVWLGELALIVIRREQVGDQDIPLLDLLPGDLDIFGGKTRSRDSGWPTEAQQFFDRRRHQAEVRFELLQLIGMIQQHQGAGADQVRGGLMAGKDQQRASFLIRYQVAMQTPSNASIYLYALMETEPAMCEALCSHLEAATNRHEIRFLVAIYMAALRLALEEWLEQEAQGDLVSLLREYLDSFSSLSHHA
jgi:hypothetical protein